MAIIVKYVREGRLYTEDELQNLFEFHEKEELNRFLGRLKQYRIVKIKRYGGTQEDASLLDDDDTDYIDPNEESGDFKYLFRYVGILYCYERIIKVYPKYIESTNEPRSQMEQVIRVLRKFSGSRKEIINSFSDDSGGHNMSYLSVILFLLEDYYENGPYLTDEEIIEFNGDGDIYWQKTVDDNYSIIKDNVPFYADFYTRRRMSDDQDYFKRLHETVLTDCSHQIERAELTTLLSLPIIELSDETLDCFGDANYVLDRIDSEMTQQFDDRKSLVLKALREYMAHEGKMLQGDQGVVFYGTRSFHTVWEEVCAKVFANQRNLKLKDLRPGPNIDYSRIRLDYELYDPITENLELVQLIKKPEWHVDGYNIKADATFRPDYLSFDEDTDRYVYYILDAKYYCPEWTKKDIHNNPGVEDVAKQYLYYFAYKSFLDRIGVTNVRNYFLMPKETGIIENPGYVRLDIWRSLKSQPEDIGIRKLPADMMFESYINENTIRLSELR